VFLDAGWRIGNTPRIGIRVFANPCTADQPDLSPDEDVVPQRVGTFLSAYIPLPLFVLLTIGYKLVHQTKMVPLDKMVFNVYDVQEVETVPNSKYFLARLWYKII
jgi:amino acid transporter